jgi:DNA-binding transcriptional LysR family regulator
VTPTQLRAFSAVVRLGSVRLAAAELGVSDAAVSLHVAQLRKELGDQLFSRTGVGIAFTPGGLRLASRAAEMLGLQDRTIFEVSHAGAGRRLLRVASSSLFAEYSAPGLIELFASRADDLDVELSVHGSHAFDNLLLTRTVDAAIGPRRAGVGDAIACVPFLNYQVVVVVSPEHRLAKTRPGAGQLREETWLLGPSAAEDTGLVPSILRQVGVPEEHQKIFQSHAAALEEAKRGRGVALALSFAVAQDLAQGRLKRVPGQSLQDDGSWSIYTLAEHAGRSTAAELVRFVASPRAIQAMLRGSGVTVGRFRPSIHVTLWS